MNPDQTQAQIEVFVTRFISWTAVAIPQFVMAILVLLVGLWLAGLAERATTRLMQRSGRIDPTLTAALSGIVRYAIVILVIVAALGQMGVQTTSILAALGAAGLAIGLALQGTLSNVAAGFMLLWLRPFRVGDYIDAEGAAGTVKEIGLFGTELHSWDGIFQFVPNSELWNKRVINYSRLPTRLLEIKYGISYGDDIAKAKSVLDDLVQGEPRVLGEPAPQVLTLDLGDSAVILAIRVWTKTADYWAARWSLTEAGKSRLEAAGITIPFPQHDVHLVGGADAAHGDAGASGGLPPPV